MPGSRQTGTFAMGSAYQTLGNTKRRLVLDVHLDDRAGGFGTTLPEMT